ncbi:MAG: hypothetical protein AAFP77_19775 [Bacteroidota bacterium]
MPAYFRAMEAFDKRLLEVIEAQAETYSLFMLQRWAKNIKRLKAVNTKQLLNSLNSATRKDLTNLVVTIQFAFEEHGRFIDMRRKKWEHQPPIDSILTWIEERGLAAFGPDPKPYKRKVKTDQQRMNEIAWGIGRQHLRSDHKPKPKPWFQSTFYKSLNALYEELVFGIADIPVEQIRENLTHRLQRGATNKYF